MKKQILATILAAGFASSFTFAEGLNQSAQSELLLMVQQLQAEVRQLRGEVETQKYKQQKMEREQLERYRDMDRRLSALILSQAEAASVAPLPELAPETVSEDPVVAGPETADMQTPVVDPPRIAVPEVTVPKIDDQDAYQQAFALVRERRFDEAVTAFDSFIQKYPQSDNLANAYYWIGEVKLAQQKLEPAGQAFQTVVQRYKQHRKRPDALYKLGVVQDRLGKVAESKQSFEMLITEYPDSSAAGLARNYQSR